MIHSRPTAVLLALTLAGSLGSSAFGQRRSNRDWPTPTPPALQPVSAESRAAAITEGVKLLLAKQEADEASGAIALWPYEGVYRVRGEIPVGYRVGGTSIACLALLQAPGLADDADRQAAIGRSARFVVDAIKHPLMDPGYDGGYDVRGWGYTYGLKFLLAYRTALKVPEDLAVGVEDAIQFYIHGIEQTEIPKAGGWNYARPAGREKVAPPSPFMTGPTLEALYEAHAAGYDVDAKVVSRALDALDAARTPSGSYVYAGSAGRGEPTPGSVGRMLASETALYLAGRSDQTRLRGAIDAFLVHWPWLDQRRQKNGTHEGPYGIAPYYYYYAHLAAARAIEMLPAMERGEYRRRYAEVLFATREEDGSWNDRVFPRSSAFGTSMAMLSLMAPEAKAPARWEEPAKADMLKQSE